jgi:predicted site-specific integrase-resolvase
MKLSHWAKSQGISYRTAWRMWKDGTLPTSARQLPTGTIIVDDPKSPSEGSVALYVRVSTLDFYYPRMLSPVLSACLS